MKRQFHVITPWGDINSTSTNTILLLELPYDEPFESYLTQINTDTVRVIIHAGLCTAAKDIWGKSHVFTLTSDGEVTHEIYVGTVLERKDVADWQVWAYRRYVALPFAADPYARKYAEAYMPNAPLLTENPESPEPEYFAYSPRKTTVNSSGGAENLAIKVYKILDKELTAVKEAVKGKTGDYYTEVTVQSPMQELDDERGTKGQVRGLVSGWGKERWDNSKARILAVSAVYGDI